MLFRNLVGVFILLTDINVVRFLLFLFLGSDTCLVENEFAELPAEEGTFQMADTGFWLAITYRKVVSTWNEHTLDLLQHQSNFDKRVVSTEQSIDG